MAKRKKVKIKPIRSDFDGKQYYYPDVEGELDITPSEIEEKVYQLQVKQGKYGLYGLRLSPKLEAILNYRHRGQRFYSLDWITNVEFKPEDVADITKRGFKIPRQLKLLSLEGKCIRVFEIFSIHPKSGELIGSSELSGQQHADQIANYGSYPFKEYLRLVHTGKDSKYEALDTGVLLSRPYYNPPYPQAPYDYQKDKEVTLHILALLIKNGLPLDTRLILSADRQTFGLYGFR